PPAQPGRPSRGRLHCRAALWLVSFAVPAPDRYALWAVGIGVDLASGLVAYLRIADKPRQRSQMPERLGLFTLIVLGESLIAVSAGTAQAHRAASSAATAGLGFLLAALLWWMYFARLDEEVFDYALAGAPQRAAPLVPLPIRTPDGLVGHGGGRGGRQARDRGDLPGLASLPCRRSDKLSLTRKMRIGSG
nr:low temperature requirement protein A [Actinomycetota bacterium]